MITQGWLCFNNCAFFLIKIKIPKRALSSFSDISPLARLPLFVDSTFGVLQQIRQIRGFLSPKNILKFLTVK
jgi:hypothetical protein